MTNKADYHARDLIQQLEYRISDLERTVSDLERQVSDLEHQQTYG